MKLVLKLAALITALVLLFAAYAVGQTSRPVTVTCADVVGGPIATDAGINLAQRIGNGIHQLVVDGKELTDIKNLTDLESKVFTTSIKLWWGSLRNGANGQKLDPQALEVQRQARQIRAAAEQACTPCPSNPADNTPGTDTGPSTATVAQDTNLTGAALAESVAVAAGFPTSEIPMAVAVERAESGYNPRAVNKAAFTHGTVRGIFQVYYGVHPELNMSHGFDPYANAKDAYTIWKAAGGSWSPWSTAATARASLSSQQLPEARAQAEQGGGNVGGQPSGVAKACVTADGSMSNPNPDGTFADIATPTTWGTLGNPNTPAQALAYMKRMDASNVSIPVDACLHYVATAYGWTGGSGEPTALAEWNAIPASMKHPGRTIRSAPAGALLFWRTGNPAGHIAIADGQGGVYSTDAPTRGQIGHVSIATIDNWGGEIGFAAPVFPARVKVNA